ncbi:unnamed protein product [Lupinus luteus]|uniref:Protein TILLER ANGLE CONTROL 1 n=1 Tax=Lupinus luteus TaxID=3873 RepID=A0AAV1WQH8_LUPLU
MKIFNWVHKRFHHRTLNDGLASNMKSTEHIMNNVDGEALLKQVGLVDLLDDWKDGILTIGTLGYEHMNTFNQNKEYFALESEIELDHEDYYKDHILVEGNDDYNNYNGELEELKPLVHTIFENNFEDFISANSSMVDYDGAMESKNVESDLKKKGERTTLADLFLADSNAHIKVGTKALLHSSEKPSLHAKHGMLFPKKFIPYVKDNPHPIKHIKKLMKKMLKSKIHPEHDVKNHKLEGQKGNDEEIIDNHHKHGASDTTSFFPI